MTLCCREQLVKDLEEPAGNTRFAGLFRFLAFAGYCSFSMSASDGASPHQERGTIMVIHPVGLQ